MATRSRSTSTTSKSPKPAKKPLNIEFGLSLESTYSFLLSRLKDLNKDLNRKQIEAQDKYNDIISASDAEKRRDYDADFTVLENYINKIGEKIKIINDFEEKLVSELNTQRDHLYDLSDMALDVKDHLQHVQVGTLEGRMRDIFKDLSKEEFDKLPPSVRTMLKRDYKGGKSGKKCNCTRKRRRNKNKNKNKKTKTKQSH